MAEHGVDLLIDGVWTPVRTLESDRVRLSGGRSKDAGDSDPSRIECTIINQDGDLTPRNPRSVNFGKIGQGTQLRVTLPAETHLRQTGAAARCETPDVAALDVTGDLDIRIEIQVETPKPDLGYALAGKYDTVGNQRSWSIGIDDSGFPFFRTSPDGTIGAALTTNHDVEIPYDDQGRITLRFVMDVNNGSGGATVSFYYAYDGVDAPGGWTQLGSSWIFGSTTSIFASTAPVVVGRSGVEFGNHPLTVYGFQLRNGIAGTVVANPDFTLATPGASTLVDSTGKTWTVNATASFRDVEVRGIGELAKWPTRWTVTEALKTAPVQASGLTRRLSRPSAKLRSPLYREAIAADNLPRMDAYWPGEDGTEATQLASGIPGGSPMTIVGSPSLAASTRIPGSDALLSLTTGSTLTGAVPLETATGQIAFRMVVDVPDASWGADVALVELHCNGGAVRRWRMFVTPAGDMYLRGYNSIGTLIASGGHVAVGLNGLRGMLGFQFTQSGSDVLWQVFARRIQEDLTVVEGGFAATFTALGLLGRPERLTVAPDGDIDGGAVGQFMVGRSTSLAAGITTAIVGNAGETAGDRMKRLGLELGHTIRIVGKSRETEPMGPQPSDTALNLYRECADTDGGILYEPRDEFALEYRTRGSMYNSPAVAITYDQPGESPDLEPDEPADDVVNDYTVTRRGGSSFRAVVESGPMSVLDFPAGVSRWEDAAELNFATDSPLFDAAWWQTHVSAWDEFRYPVVSFNLAKLVLKGKADLAYAVGHRSPGDRIVISNPPGDLPPMPLDLMVQGWAEEFAEGVRSFEVNTTPGRPWVVGVAGVDPADSDGTTLTSSITAGQTSFQWDVVGTPWATDSAYPLMMVFLVDDRESERFEVTNIVGATSPQTVTAVRGVDDGWARDYPAGTAVRLYTPLRVAR